MIKLKLTGLSFLQFFIWGSWLITIGSYCFGNKQWQPDEFGIIFSTMGFAALFMPAVAGIITDRFVPAQVLYGIFHMLGGIGLFLLPIAETPTEMFWILLGTMFFYMPTISLSNTVAYTLLKKENLDIIKSFPPIRVWGTIGFIIALWTISLSGWEQHAYQFYVGGISSLVLAIFAFTLPNCPPLGKSTTKSEKNKFLSQAFTLIRDKRFAIFLLFAMGMGAALQLTNMYGTPFLNDFNSMELYKNSLTVKYPAMIMSISQISETLFILTIPFFMKKFGIKKVILFSIIAWVLRFGLFSFGNPGDGLWMIVLSCIIYGMAFDFFNVSGSLYIEQNVSPNIRSSAQGMFTMMVNGIGAVLGSLISGYAIQKFYIIDNITQQKDWSGIWMSFTIYSIILGILFVIFFRENHSQSPTES
ncbi:MAG: nucleoside permease [Bacteroidia bacterium]